MILLVACNAIPASKLDRTDESNLTCIEDFSKSGEPPIPVRTHCYAPPWTSDKVDGLTAIECSKGTYVFKHEGTRKPKEGEQLAFLEKHRKEMHAIAGVNGSGFGQCCRTKELGYGC